MSLVVELIADGVNVLFGIHRPIVTIEMLTFDVRILPGGQAKVSLRMTRNSLIELYRELRRWNNTRESNTDRDESEPSDPDNFSHDHGTSSLPPSEAIQSD